MCGGEERKKANREVSLKKKGGGGILALALSEGSARGDGRVNPRSDTVQKQ